MSQLPQPLDLSRHSPTWDAIPALLPQVAQQLERLFRNRYGYAACPDAAVSSAVRVLLEQLPSGTVNFQTFDDLFGWVLTVAFYKLRDQIDREHLDRRKGLDAEVPDRGGLVESASNEAAALLESVRVQLNQEQRIVFDGRMEGHSLSRIAQDNGWSAERARCLMNQIRLLAREVHQDEPV